MLSTLPRPLLTNFILEKELLKFLLSYGLFLSWDVDFFTTMLPINTDKKKGQKQKQSACQDKKRTI